MSAQISKKTRIPNRTDRTFVKNGYSRTDSKQLLPLSELCALRNKELRYRRGGGNAQILSMPPSFPSKERRGVQSLKNQGS